MNNEDQTRLEALVDRHGLQDVLEVLEIICIQKAEHLRTNWQDVISAKAWDKRASVLSIAQEKV